MNNVTMFAVNECCGCGICAKKCPKNLLDMETNNEGFLYPVMIDKESCVNCGVCVQMCPAHNRKAAVSINYDTPQYAFHPDDEICRASSSGAVANGLYRSVLHNNGVGFGVSYTKDFLDAEYIMIEEEGQIAKLRGSKYIKACENNLYELVKEQAESGKLTLVIGLPCEIAALKTYLTKEYSNLYTCELICHGPTSHLVLQECVKDIQARENSKIIALNQRAKKPYWKPYYFEIELDNGHVVSFPFSDSDFEKAFQIMKRPSCNSCAFKDGMTCSDLIIGDFHGAQRDTEEYNKYGVSICFPCTTKGERMIEMLKEEGYIVGDANKRRALGNRALHEPIPEMSIRKRYVRKLLRYGLAAAGNDVFVKIYLKKRKIQKRLMTRFKCEKK